MAEFRATPDDLREFIHCQKLTWFKRQIPYPIGAIIFGIFLIYFFLPLAFIAFGMCLAWSLSLFLSFRNIAPDYLWRYAWMQENVVINVLEEGISISNQRGSSVIRWDGGIVIRSIPGSFIIEDEGVDMVVLPKKYFNTAELLSLQNHVNG